MDLELLTQNLEQELLDIDENSNTIIERCKRSIVACNKLLQLFQREINKNGFSSVPEEIYFFQFTKQMPLQHLIYFSEILSFELQFPKADKVIQRKFTRKKIQNINRFFIYNLDFIQYTDSDYHHFDREYYTREFLDNYHIVTSKVYFQDSKFSTPRDLLLGKFRAYGWFLIYLENRLANLTLTLPSTENTSDKLKKLAWPFTNTDWVELVYAIYFAGLSHKNNLNIRKVSKALQQTFDYIPKDLYKTFQHIKYRKNSKTLFLDSLCSALLLEIKKSHE
ncbi:RteC domain-containing protein [Gelidibacter mesophilus]|uniref:RteC domain-containing protein n=1 Tax=Gelidibacter mesophilus TaxID=169050 RepID=UPI00040CC0F1|nr:RteC domain-containing protein [Gelidibacter mesophilus]